MKLYMKVTNDIYELPEVVCESAIHLAQEIGVKVDSIHSVLSRHRNGIRSTRCYREVEFGFDKEKFGELYRKLNDKSDFMEYMGVKNGTVAGWIAGRTEPGFARMEGLCNYFGVDEDYFFKY